MSGVIRGGRRRRAAAPARRGASWEAVAAQHEQLKQWIVRLNTNATTVTHSP
jgi:hypothetical protein